MVAKDGLYTNLSYASQGRATAWEVCEATDGVHLRTISGTLLCRLASGNVYFWDKFERAEVQISLDQINRLAGYG